MTSWRVTVAVGEDLDVDWEMVHEDDEETEPGYGLTDDLTIRRVIPAGDLWPAQPAPAEARFGLVFESFADVLAIPELDDASPVRVRYYSPSTATDPLEEFAGRITDLVATPHRLGLLLNITCVDYLADLAEWNTAPGLPDGYSTTGTLVIVNSLPYYAGLGPAAILPYHPQDSGYIDLDPNVWFPEVGVPLLQALEQLLVQWTFHYQSPPAVGLPTMPARLVVVQNTDDGVLDDTTPYYLVPMFRDGFYAAGDVTANASVAPLTIDAGKIALGGSWTRRKGDRVAGLDITFKDTDGDDGSISTMSPYGSVRASIATGLTTEADAVALHTFYLPTATDPTWSTDTYTWLLRAEPDGTYLSPAVPATARLGGYVHITNLDDRWTPTGDDFHGLLGGYTLSLRRGKPSMDLDLRRPLDEP